MLNPGATPVTFRVTVMRAGRASTLPTDTQRIAGPGQARGASIWARRQVPADAFVVVDATGPVVVERESTAMPGISCGGGSAILDR